MSTTWAEKWSKYGVKGYLILIADQQGGPPTKGACKQYQNDYGIEIPLLFDPEGLTKQYGTMETTYVLDQDAVITYEQFGDWLVGLEKEIEAILGFEME